jgi:hypothetical protein
VKSEAVGKSESLETIGCVLLVGFGSMLYIQKGQHGPVNSQPTRMTGDVNMIRDLIVPRIEGTSVMARVWVRYSLQH